MMKKPFLAILAVLLMVSTVVTNTAFASETLNVNEGKKVYFGSIGNEFLEKIQNEYDSIGEYLEDNFTKEEIAKIKEEYLKEYGTPLNMDDEISTMALSFWTLVLVGALGGLIATATWAAATSAWNWLASRSEKDGSEALSCTAVKISGVTFNPTLASNWVGSGYNNSSKIVKALQEYINRAYVGVTVPTNGVLDFQTDRGIRALERALGEGADGKITTREWMLMGGSTLLTPYSCGY